MISGVLIIILIVLGSLILFTFLIYCLRRIKSAKVDIDIRRKKNAEFKRKNSVDTSSI